MKVTVKLETFEGPLDLLLHLIDKAEVDIYDIPIKDITDQYMEYLDAMQELELEVTSEFLVMAATLLSIKSKMLLPKPPVVDLEFDDYMMDEDYDPRAELVAKLIEYRKYKAIADHLRDKEVERSLIFTREPEDLTPYVSTVIENPVKGLHVADLVHAFRKALRRMHSRQAIAKIRKDEISVKDRMLEVLEALESQGGKVLFSRLLQEDTTREAVVVTFLAMLELMKIKRIICFQHRLFDDIVIQAREDGTANGLWTDEISY
ncbi:MULTISPECIES: segregation and condensation protein A [Paenibacillus]|uniref:Segregation and condensation protein A n=1 Tax=Paenibacillus naphthalenovorans TaxID=162209 RepID=A0A0U2L018_9BACL|nr:MULTISPECIES: segregation/condensation protein A [Paenibacillus]ALS22738.1 segregation and condensation protein A [Paenibacillus naphthalenovorans]NTZ17654.1 segregation/condensation protein A [Paenibacillus sp. JMULE4]GCL70533.1 segregation/condensation protein A [Paenibacillus naphthalenovorans]SDH79184.1 condensin subunit ScpA [Paenibacillus naphthalenovorans]